MDGNVQVDRPQLACKWQFCFLFATSTQVRLKGSRLSSVVGQLSGWPKAANGPGSHLAARRAFLSSADGGRLKRSARFWSCCSTKKKKNGVCWLNGRRCNKRKDKRVALGRTYFTAGRWRTDLHYLLLGGPENTTASDFSIHSFVRLLGGVLDRYDYAN